MKGNSIVEYGFVSDDHRKGITVRFLKIKEQVYLLNGGLIAHTFKLKTPTSAKIEHVDQRNMFKITCLPDDEKKLRCDHDGDVEVLENHIEVCVVPEEEVLVADSTTKVDIIQLMVHFPLFKLSSTAFILLVKLHFWSLTI